MALRDVIKARCIGQYKRRQEIVGRRETERAVERDRETERESERERERERERDDVRLCGFLPSPLLPLPLQFSMLWEE